jgi:hypothetical protein
MVKPRSGSFGGFFIRLPGKIGRSIWRKPLILIISSFNDNTINGLKPPEPLDVLAFYSKIRENIDCGIFRNFGGCILGGCGQLRQARGAYIALASPPQRKIFGSLCDEKSDLCLQFLQQRHRSGVLQRRKRAWG